MKRVQGIGGIFFKAKDPQQLQAWYDKHLEISTLPHSPWGKDDTSPLFEWRDKDNPDRRCYTVFGIFPDDTDYFDPGTSRYMLNLRVDDLDGVLEVLRKEGVQVLSNIRDYSYGRFARIVDPEGNPIELWEPAKGF